MSKNNSRSFCLVYDFMKGSQGGKTIRNNMDTICERSLSGKEYEWMISNYGLIVKRFLRYKYDNLPKMVADDAADGVITPSEVIEAAKKNSDIISNN